MHGGVGYLIHGSLRRTVQPRQHHVGLQNHSFQQYALAI
jgi:hypothetical protein